MVTKRWNPDVAMAWVDDSFWSRRLVGGVRGRWLDPRPLAPIYRSVPYEVGQCLLGAVETARRDRKLRVAMGYVFRDEEPSRGVRHAFCLTPAGEVVDVAVKIWGEPVGYIGGALDLDPLCKLCAANAIAFPQHFADELVAARRSGRRTRAAA